MLNAIVNFFAITGLTFKFVRHIGSAGVKGELKVFTSHEVHDKDALDKMANAKHTQLTFDGYEGKITTFL